MQQPTTTASPPTGFLCPHCQRRVAPSQRLSYPLEAIGCYASVYRCRCGKMIGEPIGDVRHVMMEAR